MWRLKSRLPTAFNEGLGNGARDLVTEESGGIARDGTGRGRSPSDTQHRLAAESLPVHLQRDCMKFKLWQERCGILTSRVTYCSGKLEREESCEHTLICRYRQRWRKKIHASWKCKLLPPNLYSVLFVRTSFCYRQNHLNGWNMKTCLKQNIRWNEVQIGMYF